MVTWWSYGQDGDRGGTFAQAFDPRGMRLGTELQVNTYTTSIQRVPAVTWDRSGAFVVVWASYYTGEGFEMVGQQFSSAGQPLGVNFRVNSYTTSNQWFSVAAASDGDGHSLVTWMSDGQDGDDFGVFGRFMTNGVPQGLDFRLNAYTTGRQLYQAVASDQRGNFIAVWESAPSQDGSGAGIYAQRLGGVAPAGLSVGGGANDVLQPGEATVVRPSWGNYGALDLALMGTATGFSGPPGGAYSLLDASADYGIVSGNGGTGQCSGTADCYAVRVTAPSGRPATHWDTRLTEVLSILPTEKHWTLHVGGSFTDVPRSSGFYRFVETLLHRGVTAGCSASDYCPASAVSREQMAVLVLVAKEGAGFSPPACSTPLFSDVPASSPFCRYVEELARRGVVAGCGGSNFCPSAPVSRAETAVFVLKTLEPALSPPACQVPMFNDVPAASPFCRWIEELARRGVVAGCGSGLYCPDDPASREQMAVILTVAFGLTLYSP